MNALTSLVLELAAKEIGVRERGRNLGPEIEAYNREIGHDPAKADPWCAIFVSAMFKRAAAQLGVPMPFHPTAGVFTLEEKAPAFTRIATAAAGAIFILKGHTHTGLVESAADVEPLTIEGNTNPGGSSEGDGVYRRSRHPSEILCYLDFSLSATAAAG